MASEAIPESKKTFKDVPELIPARMLNEFAYCPRLCYIEWVQGEFLDSADTVDGRFQHRRIDRSLDKVPEALETFHSRSINLSGAGIACRIDLLEGEGGRVIPVDYKRGEAPNIPEGAYEPERVQLCAQCLALRENGFVCDEGIIYFVKSKKKVLIQFDDSLVSRTKELITLLRTTAEIGEMPPPLEYSPKCFRCSLAGICLPDEVTLLKEMEAENIEVHEDEEISENRLDESATGRTRRLLPSRDDAIPIYVVGQGNTVRKKEDRLEILSTESKVSEVKTREISQLSIYGGVEITTPAMVELMQRGIPVIHYTHGGWFQGICLGTTHKNVELRMRQFEYVMDPHKSIKLARKVVAGKIKNCRTLVRRNDPERSKNSLDLLAVGFDPYLGFYHRPRYGRPALALDMMEEFRPLIADSVAITLFNNEELSKRDFIRTGVGVTLTPEGKKSVIRGYERRMKTEITHPIFSYKVSYRRVLEVQSRLLARVISGEIREYPPFCTR